MDQRMNDYLGEALCGEEILAISEFDFPFLDLTSCLERE